MIYYHRIVVSIHPNWEVWHQMEAFQKATQTLYQSSQNKQEEGRLFLIIRMPGPSATTLPGDVEVCLFRTDDAREIEAHKQTFGSNMRELSDDEVLDLFARVPAVNVQ